MESKALLLCCFYVAFLCHLQGFGQGATQIRLNPDFRLENVLISVQDENFFTVDNVNKLRGLLAVTSDAMARATEAVGRRISISVARVLVPTSKVADLKAAGFEFVPATWESEANADIRMLSSKSNITGAKAIPADECYGPNRYLQMPDYLVRSNVSANQILREFSILRWGVLSERTNETFYQDEISIRPAVCSINIPVKFKLKSQPYSAGSPEIGVCDQEITRLEGNRSKETMQKICEFTKEMPPNNDLASILYEAVPYFCDDSTGNSSKRHNNKAPNPQNIGCRFQSAAAVLRQHADFLTTLEGASVQETVPTLLLVDQNTNRDIVLLLDVSGSMLGSRIQNLIRAATVFVKYFAESGARLSIIKFNESVTVLQRLEKLTDDQSRDRAAEIIQSLVASGFTNIADSITRAMQILGATAPYSKSQTGFVILLTDGEHNTAPDLNSTILKAAQTSIVFDTICISSQADPRMAWLAQLTGGQSMFVSASMPVTVESEIAFSKLAERAPGGGSNAFLLQASTISLPTASGTVLVNDTKTLYFMVSLPNVNLTSVNFTGTSPNGKLYGSFTTATGVYQTDPAIGTIIIRIPTAEIVAGAWTWYVTSTTASGRKRRSADEPIFLVRKSRSTSPGSVLVVGGSSSVVIDAWLKSSSFAQVTQASIQKIYAYITDNGAPLIGATIEASIVPASGTPFAIAMKDDGLGADLTANDGIYVCQILPERLTVIGDYGVTIVMTSPVGRTTSAGKFRVETLATTTVTVPPGRVTDLSVTSSVKFQNVTVQFTSPGNQAYEGIPAAYEIRASNSFDQLTKSFASCPLLARPTGQLAGSVLKIGLSSGDLAAIQTNITFFMAVAAVGTSGVIGETSFPIGSVLVYAPITGTSSISTPAVTPGVKETVTTVHEKLSEWTGELIGAATGLGVVIAFEIAAIVLVCVKL